MESTHADLQSLHKATPKNCLIGVTRPPMFGGPLSFIYLNMFSVDLYIFVFEGARVLRDGMILRVSGNCSLCEVLQEVGFSDRVDNVLSVRPKTLPPNKTLS